MEIEHISLDRMHNSTNLGYHYDFINMLQEHPAVAAKIPGPIGEYRQICDRLDADYKNIAKSPLTKQIQDADRSRDDIWLGIIHYVKAYLRHPAPAMREHARRLKIVIDTYGKGKLAMKSLIDQTTDTTNIVQDFESPYLADATAVGILPWIIELKARNITVKNLLRDRVNESGAKSHTNYKEVRARADGKNSDIVKIINAFVLMEGPTIYEELINTANANIAKYKTLMAQSSKRGKKGNEEEEELEGGSDEN